MNTINSLIDLLAKVSCQENKRLSLLSTKYGYAVIDNEQNLVIPPDDSMASLYESIEERYYSNMYRCFAIA